MNSLTLKNACQSNFARFFLILLLVSLLVPSCESSRKKLDLHHIHFHRTKGDDTSKYSPPPNSRPAPCNRTFNSTVINTIVDYVSGIMSDRKLAKIFENCFPNTLDTTVQNFTRSPLDTFIITGDIDAMWLRDSTNQVFPYIPYAR